MDRLARALLDLRGCVLTNAKADEIKRLYDDLSDYDKRPLTFQQRSVRQPRGRFSRSKTKENRSGHVGVTQMER